jgi:AcrR family transcriptional regulator
MAQAAYRETKRLKAHERSRIILDCARSILVDEGYAELTLRRAAQRAGVRLGTLQYYYPTKKQLFHAAFEDALREESEHIDDRVARAGTNPEKRLRALYRGAFQATGNKQTTGFFLELWSRARLDGFAAKLMDDFYQEIRDWLAELIRECRPSLTKRVCKQRATFALATLEGMTLFAAIDERRGKKVDGRFTINSLMQMSLAAVTD